MTTKQMFDSLLVVCKNYIDSKLKEYPKASKEMAAFEKDNMERYSGGAAVDHVLFRKFLRVFNPDAIREAAKVDVDKKQDKVDEGLQTQEKTIVGAINEVNEKIEAQDTEALRKKLEEIEQLAYAGL